MADLPPLTRDQRKVDVDQLNLLAIFHFVGAGLALVGLLFLGLHFVLFLTFVTNAPRPEGRGPMPPEQFFAVFKFFYALMAALLVASGVLNVMSGLYLRSRTHRTFSLIVAALNCIHMPIGTILGVFTIVVLVRDSVRELYEAQASAQANPYGSV